MLDRSSAPCGILDVHAPSDYEGVLCEMLDTQGCIDLPSSQFEDALKEESR